jgi:hypothetical protein
MTWAAPRKREFKRFDTAGGALGSNARRSSLRFNLLRFYHCEYKAKLDPQAIRFIPQKIRRLTSAGLWTVVQICAAQPRDLDSAAGVQGNRLRPSTQVDIL